jgi:hypothetical protein
VTKRPLENPENRWKWGIKTQLVQLQGCYLDGTGPGSPSLQGLGIGSVWNFSFHRLSFLPVGFDELTAMLYSN